MGGKLSFFRLPAPNSWNNLPAILKRPLTLFGVWTLLILFFKKASAVWNEHRLWLVTVVCCRRVLISRRRQSPFIPAELSVAGDTRTNCPLCGQGQTCSSKSTAALYPDFLSMSLGFWPHLVWTERLRTNVLLVWGVWSSRCSGILVALPWIRVMGLKQGLSASPVLLNWSYVHTHISVQCILNV